MALITNPSIISAFVIIFACLGFVISEEDPDAHPEHKFFAQRPAITDSNGRRGMASVPQDALKELQQKFLNKKYANMTCSWGMPLVVTVAEKDARRLSNEVRSVRSVVVERILCDNEILYVRKYSSTKKEVFLFQQHDHIRGNGIGMVLKVVDLQNYSEN